MREAIYLGKRSSERMKCKFKRTLLVSADASAAAAHGRPAVQGNLKVIRVSKPLTCGDAMSGACGPHTGARPCAEHLVWYPKPAVAIALFVGQRDALAYALSPKGLQ